MHHIGKLHTIHRPIFAGVRVDKKVLGLTLVAVPARLIRFRIYNKLLASIGAIHLEDNFDVEVGSPVGVEADAPPTDEKEVFEVVFTGDILP